MPIQILVVLPGAADPELKDSGTDSGSEDEVSSDVTKRAVRVTKGNVTATSNSKRKKRRLGRCLHRPVSAPVLRLKPQIPVKPYDVTMHVASAYDVEDEHDNMMRTALKAYSMHRLNEDGEQFCPIASLTHLDSARQNGLASSSPDPETSGSDDSHGHFVRVCQESAGIRPTNFPSSSTSERPSSSSTVSWSESSASISELKSAGSSKARRQAFQMALCTLKDCYGSELPPMPHTHSVPGPNYWSMQRPWSAVPIIRRDIVKEVSLPSKGCQDGKNSLEAEKTKSGKTFRLRQQRDYRPSHVTKKQTPVRTMDTPISRSAAYRLRNRTTHSWSQDATTSSRNNYHDPMTMSCPSARSLEEHMRLASAHVPRDPNPSPVIVKARGVASPVTSPGGGQRPASCYAYDGGFFLSASNASSRDYVVHPDWVSEALTVNKVSLCERDSRASRTLGPASARGHDGNAGGARHDGSGQSARRGRRCRSAPPPKHRNPITWSS